MDYFDTEFPVPNRRERIATRRYFDTESDFMPKKDFYTDPANITTRRRVVSTIATHWRNTDMDAYIPYLAMNYFDRFASRNPVLDTEVPLVAISCLTIAAKMRTKSFCLTYFLDDRSIDFTHETIRTTELRILDSLGWRMRPITPFTFLDHYYLTCGITGGGFKRRNINEIIVQAQGVDDFIEYKPSQIAESSFIAAVHIAYPLKFASIKKPEELRNCYLGLIDLCRNKNIEIERRRRVTFADVEDDEEESNKAAPKRLMNFDLNWPKITNHVASTTSIHEVEAPWHQGCMIS